jgi:DNA gyrase subunit A
MSITDKTGKIIAARIINNTEEQDIMLISAKGQVVRTPLKSVSTLGRSTQGVRIMRFKEVGDKVVTIALL